MNQSRTEPGQSMEEILASIRRIIAEGERESREAGTAGATSPASESGSATSEPRREQPLSLGTDAEILVLTEMLQEDGSVVSLQPGRGEEPAAKEPASEPTSQGAGAADASDTVPDAANTGRLGDPSAGTTDLPAASEAPKSAQQDQNLERSPLSGEGSKKSDLVSEATLEASTAALTQLAQSVSRSRETPESSRTVEDLVREAIEPMLKQWIDANLSRIVERMVREAIERVVRRVE